MTAPTPTAIAPARILTTAAEAITAARELARIWSQTAASVDAERRIPRAELAALSRSGLLAVTVPREFGGPGLTTETLIEIFLILAATDTSLAQVPQNHFDFVDTLLVAAPETRALLYGEVLRGARFGNAIAEPGRPSRREIATTIVEDGEGYRLNGRKFFSTGALTAQWVPVFGKHADGRILTAYVRRDTPGLDVRADWDAFGQRGTFSGTTILDNVWVPSSQVVDRSVGDRALLVAQFAGNQLIHAAIEAGAAAGAIETAARILSRAATRRESDLARLGEFSVRTRAARTLTLRAARLVDGVLSSPQATVEAAVEAFIATDEAKSIAYELSPALTAEIAHFRARAGDPERRRLDRLWRNSRTHSLHDPVRWRQSYVGDFALNGALSPDLASLAGLARVAV
ncbi:acyl-CoA dehydrogenase family protein [Kaistia sp. MMO-174]|uniref:acyl-CoA dehydrogenase family protein n=1 Tax=Kaistia sp. MMO-174 TaxID=3081256 RepID=UPI003016FE9B